MVGLIIAGAIIGPAGLNLMLRDSSVILFGTVGLLYIMFLAGLEIDISEFKKNSFKSIVFGIYTFIIPMTLGTLMGYYLLKFSILTSILLASMFASHTLIAYPIVSKLGIIKNRAVNLAVGGTMITDTAALMVLAVIAGMTTGELTETFWLRISISMVAFGLIVLLLFPMVGRWFFKRYDDSILQYIFVIGMIFMGGFLAEVAGIEAIIGAFLAGLALNRLIPRTSPLMNRIEFVGNALFIPFFLIGVGMLIDYRSFFNDLQTLKVGAFMTVTATGSKFLAAWLTRKTFRLTADEQKVIFGLSNAQAAATLAAILVGYNIILGYDELGMPLRLLNDQVLNGTILMILITCTLASFSAQKGAQNIALSESLSGDIDGTEVESDERILIPLRNLDTVEELVNLGNTVKSKGKQSQLIGLNILNSYHNSSLDEKNAQKLMEKAEKASAASDNVLIPVIRYDSNIVNGITNAAKENKVTDIIIGLHHKSGISGSFLGTMSEGILSRNNITIMIYKGLQPLSTIRRNLVFIPHNAEKEVGFPYWLLRIWNIGRNTGSILVFYSTPEIIKLLSAVHLDHPVEAQFNEFTDWEDILVLSREVRVDDNLIFILSRPNYASYHSFMAKISGYLAKYFMQNNFTLIYPKQTGADEVADFNPSDPSMYYPITGNLQKLDEMFSTIGKLMRRR